MNKPYIHANTTHQSKHAVIVLPEIFGITEFIQRTTDRFATDFQLPAFALDHFYSVEGKTEVFDYGTGMEAGLTVMQQMTGVGFYSLFPQALDGIQAEFPAIEEFIVCGFCFGGRLAYLAGMDQRVSKVISFYGGQPHIADYYEGKSPVEALAAARHKDGLEVMAFFGGQDGSIPESDRVQTKSELEAVGISYTEHVYDQAGHAYFNDSRPERYNAEVAQKSWEEVKLFIAE